MKTVNVSEKLYSNLEEAEQDMRKSMPSVLYKYRDWTDKNHKDILLGPNVWFSHPKQLNDPFDIRVPETINYGDVNSKEFFEKIKEVIALAHPELKIGTRDYYTACSNIHDAIRADPKTWFDRNQKIIRESNLFDSVGVFSLSLNPLSEPLWAYYGNNGKGFCVGFDPVEIYKTHQCSFSKVSYTDEAPERNLLEPNEKFDSFWNFFIKQKRWEGEEEYRFVTMFIEKNESRKVRLPLYSIKEVVLGYNINRRDKEEIIEILKNKYNSKVPLYIVKEKQSSFGFEKALLNY